MVTAGMRKYKVRSSAQAAFVGPDNEDRIDPTDLFGTSRPLRLELGSGHGEFITAMAEAHPTESFVGVEHDPLRVTKTAHKLHKAGITNVRMFGGDAHAFVRFRLPDACVHRVYVLFPDPWPKPDHRRRRLVTRAFLLDLARIAAPGCRFLFGSDTHNYTMQVLANATTALSSAGMGLWANTYLPAGYRINIPTRFPTLFETYKKSEGCAIAYTQFERTLAPCPPALPWPTTGDRTRKAALRTGIAP
jgi:tRNA (guanine-N(7)-)-methyltransferase